MQRTSKRLFRAFVTVRGYATPNSEQKLQAGRYLFAWGSGSEGRLGVNDTKKRAMPTVLPVKASAVSQFACGGGHTLLLTNTGSVYAWGRNSEGQLGVGDDVSALAGLRVSSLPKTASVAAGQFHSAAISDEGELYTWGFGGNMFGIGGLGTGGRSNQKKPAIVAALQGTKIKQVSCGSFHTGALTEEGDLYVWGRGDYGRLGNGGTASLATPGTPISRHFFNNEAVTKVALGAHHTIVLTESGRLYAFGKNSEFQLGIDSSGNYYGGAGFDGERYPKLVDFFVSKGIKLKDVSCGEVYSAAVSTDGRAFVWGKTQWKPRLVQTPPIASVHCGNTHLALLTEDGQLYLYGSNSSNQLAKSRSITGQQDLVLMKPDQLPGTVRAVSCGNGFTTALVDIPAETETPATETPAADTTATASSSE